MEIKTVHEEDVKLEDQNILFFGSPKIGKTTFWSYRPKTLFLFTEPRRQVKCSYIETLSYKGIESFLKFLESGGVDRNKYDRIVIDTIDNFVRFLFQEICDKHGVTYIGDIPHGKGWARIKEYMHTEIYRIINCGFSVTFISHEKEKEFEFRGLKYTKISSSLNNQAREIIIPLVSIMAYMHLDVYVKDGKRRTRRALRCNVSPDIETGDTTGRFKDNVICEPEEEGYNNFVKAWYNGTMPDKSIESLKQTKGLK